MKVLGSYTNGNYVVTINDDGTKIKETDADFFDAQFPESMDVKITNYCDMGCPMCHEDSSIQGKHGDILNVKFIDSLRPYTEMAIGGGNPLSHPDLIPFLEKLRSKSVIANMTVNQKHFMDNIEEIQRLIDEKLIYGLGVSLRKYSDEFVNELSKFPNAVIHVINGIVCIDDLRKMYDKNLKLLILGYKIFRRGFDYAIQADMTIDNRQRQLYNELAEITKRFQVVSFDNKALDQLNVRRLLTDEQWNSFYQGDDGSHTMYVDLVKQEFALNSTSDETFELMDSIDEMFAVVKQI